MPRINLLGNKFHIRTHRRIRIQCPIYYSNDQLTGTGAVWNVSLNGWRVDGNIPLTRGTTVSLFTLLPESGKAIIVDQATVRWSRGREFGLEIQQIQPDQVAQLQDFVTSHR